MAEAVRSPVCPEPPSMHSGALYIGMKRAAGVGWDARRDEGGVFGGPEGSEAGVGSVRTPANLPALASGLPEKTRPNRVADRSRTALVGFHSPHKAV